MRQRRRGFNGNRFGAGVSVYRAARLIVLPVANCVLMKNSAP